jgi:hypothetical protein
VLFVRPTRRGVVGVFEELSRLLRRHRTRSGVADRSACLLPCVFLVLSLMVWLFSFFSSKMLRFLPGLLEKARYNLIDLPRLALYFPTEGRDGQGEPAATILCGLSAVTDGCCRCV